MSEKLSDRLWNYVGAGIPRELAEAAAALEAEVERLRAALVSLYDTAVDCPVGSEMDALIAESRVHLSKEQTGEAVP